MQIWRQGSDLRGHFLAQSGDLLAMKSRIAFRRSIWFAVVLGLMSVMPLTAPTALGQLLFVDEFDGTHGSAAFHPGGVVDVTSFRNPFGGGNGDDFVGRTNFRFTLPQDGVSTVASGSTDGKVAVLNLDTYNPTAAGATFLGTDVISKSNYAVGGGLRMTTRMRVQSGTPGGLVAAPFLYDVQRVVASNPVRDEIDHEIITNNAQSAAPDNTLTNVWNDGTFASAGSPVMISNPSGFDVTQFHDYRTDWTPTSVKWYIDNALVRTETSVVPDDPMRAHMNFWAPDSTFAAAYNAALQPSASSPGTTYRAEVDRIQIERFNTNVGANLLADASFEGFTHPVSGNGGWALFNNASVSGTEVAPQDGFASLKTYGPFQGSSNASGAFQNVPASPGQQFEGSVWAYSPSFDSIAGKQNFTNITLQFLDSAGHIIDQANNTSRNEKNTPIFDGRDTNLAATQDQWVQYTVDAVAPPGTVAVRENLFFIQVYHPLGDYNGNNAVDAADYVTWRKNIGQATLNNRGANITGPVGQADYDYWRAHFAGNNPQIGDGGAVWWDNASLVLLTASPGSGSSVAVPEASSICLAAAASLLMAGFRKRR
jgi:hypothetical protein